MLDIASLALGDAVGEFEGARGGSDGSQAAANVARQPVWVRGFRFFARMRSPTLKRGGLAGGGGAGCCAGGPAGRLPGGEGLLARPLANSSWVT